MKRSLRLTALLMAAVMCFVPVLQVQAAAISGTAVMIGLGAAAVVSSIMIGLGVMPGSDRNAFNSIVQSCTESASVGAYIRDGLIDVLRYKNSGGGIRYGVLQKLIDAVRGWLWDNRYVSSSGYNSEVTNAPCSSLSEALAYASHCKSAFTGYSGSTYCVIICGFSGFTFSNGTLSINGNQANHSAYLSGATSWSKRGYSITYTNVTQLATSPIVSSSYDVSLGDVAARSDDLTSSYADWSAGSIAVPHPGIDIPGVDTPGTGEDTGEGEEGEEGEEADKPPLVYWPTGIIDPSTDATDVLTQENIMAGTGTLDDTLTGEITGPIVGGITGDITLEETPAIPGEGEDVGTGEGTGEGDVVAPADKATFMLDLREIFPFCIPFDIYKFLNILSADPVAPVFEWKIPVPQIGKEFGFEVDLSAWDNVAAVFRKLELLAFIVGLAVLTRDKFIRS